MANECLARCSKFRSPAGLDRQVKGQFQNETRSELTKDLSLFAKMILDQSDISFTCKFLFLLGFCFGEIELTETDD